MESVATILNDDAPPTITLSPSLLEVAEGNQGFANANLQVRLSQASAKAVSVQYTTQDGTAIAGLDYTPTSGTLSFPAGITSRIISIPIRVDTLDEPPSKSFRLLLRNPANAAFPGNANTLTATITITDDNPVYRPVPTGFNLSSLIFKRRPPNHPRRRNRRIQSARHHSLARRYDRPHPNQPSAAEDRAPNLSLCPY